MARPRSKPLPPAKPVPPKKSDCPRAWTHRKGTYCKACDTLIR